MTGRSNQWTDGHRNGIKYAVAWMHRRADELNDPSAKAAMNVAANDLGREAKRGERLVDGECAPPSRDG